MAEWYATHATPSEKIRCKFQGGADLPEKYRERYRSAAPCLVEFERANPREVYCDNCKPVARKWQQLQAQSSRYDANPKKYRRRARVNRGKRAKSAGRKIRRIGRGYKCEYRDKHGRRGKDCLGTYKLDGSFQRFCEVCQKHADADRAQKYRDDHHDELLPKYRAKGKLLRDRASVGKILEKLKDMPSSWKLIVPLLLLDFSLTKRKVQALAGTHLSTRQMTRIGEQLLEWFPSWPGFGGKSRPIAGTS
jgi:hypothetical protein